MLDFKMFVDKSSCLLVLFKQKLDAFGQKILVQIRNFCFVFGKLYILN